jgi:cytochrome c biogenesis protein CcmG, thiol:disulfide interchange protein DsbE
MSRTSMWLSIAVIVAIVALTWIGTRKPSTPPGTAAPAAADEEQPHAAIGAPARFDLTLKNLDGADVELVSFKGKVVLVNFWATWCGPCKGEIPDLARLQREHGDDLVVLGVVVMDSFGDKVRAMATELGVNYPVLDGNNRDDVERAYGPFWGLPTSVVVGRDGKVANRQIGAATKARFESMIKPLL